jgi:light-regulated signal transduction histidine kinase (bacteriophytochrome)
MFVSSIGQKVLPAISRQLTQPLKHIPKNQPSLLIRYTHSEHNKVALATQEQLHKVQLGLNDKIAGVENKLTEKIAGVETRLSEKISALDTKFTKEIAGVETRLTEKFTKEIAGVETRLTEKIAKSHTELSDKIANSQAALLTAIEKQNTKFEQQNARHEKFEKKVYGMLVAAVATCIGYVERNRFFTLFGAIKPN